MTKPEISGKSDEDLVKEFERITMEMSKCELSNRYNRLMRSLGPIAKTLEARGPDSFKKLLPYLTHSVPRVRYCAAVVCYAFATEQCRQVLLDLTTSNTHPATTATVFLLDRDQEFRNKYEAEAQRRHRPFTENHDGENG